MVALGPYRTQEQTGRRPVIVWESDTLTRLLQSVLVVPLTTKLDRAKLAGTALIAASEGGLVGDRGTAGLTCVRTQPRSDLGGFFDASASSADGCSAVLGRWAGCAAKKSSTERPMSFAI